MPLDLFYSLAFLSTCGTEIDSKIPQKSVYCIEANTTTTTKHEHIISNAYSCLLENYHRVACAKIYKHGRTKHTIKWTNRTTPSKQNAKSHSTAYGASERARKREGDTGSGLAHRNCSKTSFDIIASTFIRRVVEEDHNSSNHYNLYV